MTAAVSLPDPPFTVIAAALMVCVLPAPLVWMLALLWVFAATVPVPLAPPVMMISGLPLMVWLPLVLIEAWLARPPAPPVTLSVPPETLMTWSPAPPVLVMSALPLLPLSAACRETFAALTV